MTYPPERKPGNNRKYQVEDAVMAAFSIFFTQSASFLDHQRLMKSNKGKDNAESLFSIEKIPCDNQIRNLLDPVPAATIFTRISHKTLEKRGQKLPECMLQKNSSSFKYDPK
uniref:Transposase n=1 Tax=Nostoc flagelliforme str. Sunitezuoqi TaxID=676037 RepID=E7DPX8_9NOSO|nr:hypothetical protein Nfla_5405 [Nostoc flagelliforme str. Sunitezuoqi]